MFSGMGGLKLLVKDFAKTRKSSTFLELWKDVLESGENVLALVKIMLVIPIHTVEVERYFSVVYRVKTDWKNRLKPSTVSDQV